MVQGKRTGFTAIETLLTIGVLGISAGISVPIYRQYVIRNDLEIARQNVAQGLQRAKFLSQVAMNDSPWGFSTNEVPGRGVLFMGESYALRSADFDELYSLPETINVSGITEVSFSKIAGKPSQAGTITLTALNGQIAEVEVGLDELGNISIPDDWLTICHDPGGVAQTMKVPDAVWLQHQAEGLGDYLGECGSGDTGGTSGGTTGGDTGGTGDSGTTGGDSGGSGGGVGFTISGKAIIPDEDYTCDLKVLGAALQYGSAYNMPITMRTQEDGVWQDPFGNWLLPVSSNVNSGQSHDSSCEDDFISGGTPLHVKARSWQKRRFWYTGNKNKHWKAYLTISTTTNSPNVEVLVNGDPIPAYAPLNNQSTIEEYLEQYINLDTGTMNMDSNQAIYLFELGTTSLQSSAADSQDLVLLLTLQPAQ